MIIDGLVHVVGPGQGIVILPHQGHDYGRFEPGPLCWLFITFEIDGDEIFQALRSVPCDFDDVSHELLSDCCRCFLRAQAGDAAAGDLLALRLGEILCRLLRRAGEFAGRSMPGPVPARHELLRRVVAMVHENLDRQLPLAEVAERLALSGSRLRTLFRQQTGIGLGEFIARKRMDRARSLLRLSEMTVSEVAAACGFGTVYSFSRAFAQRNGEPPTGYRLRVRAPAARTSPGAHELSSHPRGRQRKS